jgi:hypothetical protein
VTIYVASKAMHAEKWRLLRARGHCIISTWIDEAGAGESGDYAELAHRCLIEACQARVTLFYCQPGEIHKGALVEVGAALAAGNEVRCVGDCESIPRVFRKHHRWIQCDSLAAALADTEDSKMRRGPTGEAKLAEFLTSPTWHGTEHKP